MSYNSFKTVNTKQYFQQGEEEEGMLFPDIQMKVKSYEFSESF